METVERETGMRLRMLEWVSPDIPETREQTQRTCSAAAWHVILPDLIDFIHSSSRSTDSAEKGEQCIPRMCSWARQYKLTPRFHHSVHYLSTICSAFYSIIMFTRWILQKMDKTFQGWYSDVGGLDFYSAARSLECSKWNISTSGQKF